MTNGLRAGLLVAMTLLPVAAWPKSGSVSVTAQMRAAAQENVRKYPWARRIRDRAARAADYWANRSDAELWMMVTPQSLPRTIHTTLIRGTNRTALCPRCREGIIPFGNYPWKSDPVRRPWKLQCPNCGEIFPKNDFWAYYLSALDEHGKFQPGKGDPALLVNPKHPDPKDPLHRYGVDDGYGWYDAEGTRWAFVAYYNSWANWGQICKALNALAEAYTLTGDVRYAHKAGVLLDRIADVYPEMDMSHYIRDLKFEHSDGSSGRGRIEGRIWECAVARDLALAYDRVYDGMAADPTLPAFLEKQAGKYRLPDKGSFAHIERNIEDGLLLEIVKGVKDGRILGNEGMHQVAMAAAAIALDRQPLTNELLDSIFAPREASRQRGTGRGSSPGGNIPYVVVEKMDRDGMGSEGAPGYCCWGRTMLPLAELLDKYPAYTRFSLFRDFPKYKQCFLTPIRWACLGQATPSIGDSGACGRWGVVGSDDGELLKLFEVYREPILARRLMELCGNDPSRIPKDIYSQQPEVLSREVVRLAGGPTSLSTVNLNGFGLAIAQTPQARQGSALWVYYGRNSGHGHRDRLNIGLYAQNLDMLPDLGYPEYASGRPMDVIWERNSIAHNVVVVDDLPQQSSYTGHLLLLDGRGKAQVIEAESPGIFAGATTYRRTSVLVDAGSGNSYVVDLFRVRGGHIHRQSWHGPAASASSPELRLVPQAKGTYAGTEIARGELPENWRSSPGYMYLYDVQRDCRPPQRFTVDYKAEDRRNRIVPGSEPHLRLTCLTSCTEVALAHGDPPHNKSGNPRQLAFAVLTRSGKDLESLFATILEPYQRQPIIRQVRQLPVMVGPKDQLVSALEVTLVNGRVDTILSCERLDRLEVEGGFALDGTLGIVARRGEKVEFAKLIAGRSLVAPGLKLESSGPFAIGTVLSTDADDPADNGAVVAMDDVAAGPLDGNLILFENDKIQDAAYTIRGVKRVNGGCRIGLGDATLVRGFKNASDFSAGHVYNVEPGDKTRIPLSVYLEPRLP